MSVVNISIGSLMLVDALGLLVEVTALLSRGRLALISGRLLAGLLLEIDVGRELLTQIVQQAMHHLLLSAHRVALNVQLVLQASDAVLQLRNLALVLFLLLLNALVGALLLLVKLRLRLLLFLR